MRTFSALSLVLFLMTGCGDPAGTDGGPVMMDAGSDGGGSDGGGIDSGPTPVDAGADAGTGDDGGAMDGGATDGGTTDGGTTDGGTTDGGMDGGATDAGFDGGPDVDAGFDAGFDSGPPPDGGPVMTLYSCSPDDGSLRVLNPSTGATLSMVTMAVSGTAVTACFGLATHPTTGTLYGIVRTSGTGMAGRMLATLNQTSGAVTSIGTVRDGLSAIAFGSTGTLYAVTGDGASSMAETLFTLNLTTAVETTVVALGAGSDGESISQSSVDARLYHLSGISAGQIFESIDLAAPTTAPTNIPLTGYAYDEALGMVWDPRAGIFLFSSLGDDFCAVTPTGVVAMYGTLDHKCKGLAFASP